MWTEDPSDIKERMNGAEEYALQVARGRVLGVLENVFQWFVITMNSNP